MNSKQPNIVLFYTDQQRNDALGCAGNSVIQTPNLDKMAKEGVRFSRTFCQGPLCQPSRASLITGQYLHEHGQTWNRFNMNPEWPALMKQLQKAGYFTAVLGKTHFYWDSPAASNDLRDNNEFIRSFGFDYVLEEFDKYKHAIPDLRTPYLEFLRERGLFDQYQQETMQWDNIQDRARLEAFDGQTSKLPQEADLTSFIADKTIEWIQEYSEDKPFFLWVSFVAPHTPLIGDQIWSEYYSDVDVPFGLRQLPETPDNPWGRYLKRLLGPSEVYQSCLSEAVMSNKIRQYYAMTSLVDQRIGDINKAIDENGWGDNTWNFFTADHGYMMGDHCLLPKHCFYQGSVQVPNIIRPAGGMEPQVVDELTQSIDITTTILKAANAELPDDCRGRSLFPLAGEAPSREVAFSELAGPMNEENFFIMAATDRYRYVYDSKNDFPCELFDLKEDPDELCNLVHDPAYAGIRKDLHRDYTVPFMEGTLV